MANVIFKTGTRAQYNALVNKDANTLYWLTDTQELYKGEKLFGVGANATSSVAGLMSPEDKAILDSLVNSGGLNLTPIDSSIVISSDDGGASIGVNISADADNLITLKENGLFAKVDSIPVDKVTGLDDRLTAIEQSIVGGVHYKGRVDTYDDLPADAAQGDLYEVAADNSEWCWNGTDWFEYGSASGLKPIARADLNESEFAIDEQNKLNLVAVDSEIVQFKNAPMSEAIPAVYSERKYEITNGLFDDSRVLYRDGEIRVMYSKNTVFTKQNVGEGGDPNRYYFGFRAYAPEGAVGFKEDTDKVINNQTLYSFVDNPTAGTDKYGRKYSIVWLPAAAIEEDDRWTYFGDQSSREKYVGWYYSVEWYDANGKVIDSDCIRINLSNEDCHNSNLPYYMNDFATKLSIEEIGNAIVWQDI